MTENELKAIEVYLERVVRAGDDIRDHGIAWLTNQIPALIAALRAAWTDLALLKSPRANDFPFRSSLAVRWQNGAMWLMAIANPNLPRPAVIETVQVPQDRLTIDPEQRGGVPCIGGWPLANILEQLADGVAAERILLAYPGLTIADIRLALETAAWVMRDPAIPWTQLNVPGMVDFRQELRAWQALTVDLDSGDTSVSDK